MHNTGAKCAIYCRFSSESQRDNSSIEAQRRACLDFAAKQGWVVHKIYVDEAKSGTSDKREAFQEMITAAGKEPFKFILVHKLDRFARNRYDSVQYKFILRKAGVKVVSATQPIIGSGDPTEIILESVLEGMDEFYSANLARECIKGMAENARNGWHNGGRAPFGFKLVNIQTSKGPKTKLEINPAEAEIVKKIFQKFFSGQGTAAIRNDLNISGIKNRGRPWNKQALIDLLRNEKYCGDATFGKSINKRKRVFTSTLEVFTIKNSHAGIIDRKDWERAQKIIAQRSIDLTHPRLVESDYILSGKMKCNLCGSAMVGKSGNGSQKKKYRYYQCSRQIRVGPKYCTQKKLPADKLEKDIIERIVEIFKSPKIMKQHIELYHQAIDAMTKKSGTTTEQLKVEKNQILAKKARLLDIMEDGSLEMARDAFKERFSALESRYEEIESKLEELTAFAAIQSKKLTKKQMDEWAKHYQAIIEDFSRQTPKKIADQWITSITVNEKDIDIIYHPEAGLDRETVQLVRMKKEWWTEAFNMRTFFNVVGHQCFRIEIPLKRANYITAA